MSSKSFSGKAKKLARKVWNVKLVLAVIVVVAAGYMVLDLQEKEEPEEDRVIVGGVLGGPVEIGRTRIEVLNNQSVERTNVNIANYSVEPERLEIPEDTYVNFTNRMNSEAQINFLGYRKMSNVPSGKIYRIKFNAPGAYNYTVSGTNFTSQGIVQVR